ncbi:MAG: hypothetical protein JW932_18550 [Deltaproteobacteria bacterium]|nr:hypothetical protein [Deltaproteobacteria bacterium]
MGWYFRNSWQPHVSAATRRLQAAQTLAAMKKSGRDIAPITITGRRIVSTFWGDAWCKNLEAYSDYSNRLPRGRTYVRNGSVIDLQISTNRVRALVSGSDIYEVDIQIESLTKDRWNSIKRQCAGRINSLVELLRGSISKGVMEIVTRKGEGLLPSPTEITMTCSCPDWAVMCKHVAATLYGVGARLDHKPDLLFILRGVDPTEMVESAIDQQTMTGKTSKVRLLDSDELSSVFGIDIEMEDASLAKERSPILSAKKVKHPAKTGKKVISKENKKKTVAKPRVGKSVIADPASQKAASAKTSVSKRAPLKKPTKKKASVKKPVLKKTPGKKSVSKKVPVKKSNASKLTVGKSVSKNIPAKKQVKGIPSKKNKIKKSKGAKGS